MLSPPYHPYIKIPPNIKFVMCMCSIKHHSDISSMTFFAMAFLFSIPILKLVMYMCGICHHDFSSSLTDVETRKMHAQYVAVFDELRCFQRCCWIMLKIILANIKYFYFCLHFFSVFKLNIYKVHYILSYANIAWKWK